MSIRFVALATDLVRAWQSGGPDANGQPPERIAASNGGAPCRHCLELIGEGRPYLVLSHRPFPAPQPYAEQGPIFLHAHACQQGGGDRIPSFLNSSRYMVRGYNAADRIVYGTGRIVDTPAIPATAEEMLSDPAIAYVHVRSASNNCFHCRIERA